MVTFVRRNRSRLDMTPHDPSDNCQVIDELRKLIPAYTTLPASYCAVDTETTGVRHRHGDRPFYVSVCDHQGITHGWRAADIDYLSRTVRWSPEQIDEINAYIARFPVAFMFNASFDRNMLARIGVVIPWHAIRDVAIYSHQLDSQESSRKGQGLKYQAKKYFGIDDDDQAAMVASIQAGRRTLMKLHGIRADQIETESKYDYLNADPELLAVYAQRDAYRTALMPTMQIPLIARERLGLPVVREHALLPVIDRMEGRGIRLDTRRLAEQTDRFNRMTVDASAVVNRVAKKYKRDNFNAASNPQLTSLLFDKRPRGFGLPVVAHTKSGNASTDAETIKFHIASLPETDDRCQFLASLQTAKVAAKAVGYLSEYVSLSREILARRDGEVNHFHVIYPNINQVGTGTTRVSSSDPNLQNVSTKSEMPLREVYVPRPGHYWLDADYDNLEMRLLAYASGEKKLIKLFEEGGSYHLYIAELLYGPRARWKGLNHHDWKKSPEYKRVKNGNFSLGYGAGRAKADATYGVDGAYDLIKHTFTEWTAFNNAKIAQAERDGYITTMFGYRLAVDPHRAFTTALNYYIQGSAGEVMKNAMLACAADRRLADLRGEQILTVHDELLIEFPLPAPTRLGVCRPSVIAAAAAMKDCMEYPGRRIGIPLPVSPAVVVDNWAEPFSLAV